MSDRVSTIASPPRGHRRSADEAIVQQAVGVLMNWYDLPPLDAVIVVEGWAVRCDVPTTQVAEALVHGICLGKTTSCHTALLRRLEKLLRELPARSCAQSPV